MAWYNSIGIGGGNGLGPGEKMWQDYYAQQQAKAVQDQQDQADIAAGTAARGTATTTAKQQAQDFFKQRGLDSSQFDPDIDARINDLLSTVNPKDTAPGQYLRDIGQYVADARTSAGRDKANMSLQPLLTPGYDQQKIGATFDDPFIEQENTRQYGQADQYIQNLLKRGVITATGATGAEGALGQQTGRVKAQLGDIGSGLLDEGRKSLTDIGSRAKNDASTLGLGQSFDPNVYGKQLDQAYTDFTGQFGNKFSASTPDNLYDTSGLATAAGVASGPQNTKFDPNALAGLISKNQQPNPLDPTKVDKQTTLF